MPVFSCVFFPVFFFYTDARGICVQYSRFPRMKHACNAAMPVACTVDSEDSGGLLLVSYGKCLVTVRNSPTQDHTLLMIISHIL